MPALPFLTGHDTGDRLIDCLVSWSVNWFATQKIMLLYYQESFVLCKRLSTIPTHEAMTMSLDFSTSHDLPFSKSFWEKFSREWFPAISNKAGYAAAQVACRWAGAVLEKVTRVSGQELYAQKAKKRQESKKGMDQPTD